MTPGRTLRMALLAALLGLAACGPAEGPQPIVYDREPCAHCRMLISEPGFAAQLEAQDGRVASFDDPGCLLAYLDAHGDAPRALWFHHSREERWLAGEEVGFVPAEHTPMGYGLAAVDAGTPGAIPLAEARRRVQERAGAGTRGSPP